MSPRFLSIAVPHGEIEQFLGLPVAKHNADPLEWWEKNEQQFPRLAAVARQVLSVQPTSTPSERVFRASGIVFSKKRISLTPDNANKLIFMHLNDAVFNF